jgi:hypothetical protein
VGHRRASRVIGAVIALVLLPLPAGAAGAPLQTALWDPGALLENRIEAAGGSVVVLRLAWADVAPRTRPERFRPDDPADPAYNWSTFDARLRALSGRGLIPVANVYAAPPWAEGAGRSPPGAVPGSLRPSPLELGHFAKAAARRYSGSFQGLPLIRRWQLWTEQNLYFHLNPQLEGKRAVGPAHYRAMLNAFADAVHSVHRDNLVVTGGLAPFTSRTGSTRQWGLGPLHFMRLMLCMGRNFKPTCNARARFDVWAHHPYTSGGPNHHAHLPDDVSLGDLPEMRRMLNAAVRAGRVVSRHRVGFWVTEFGWDTSPPDPKGIQARLHARWVAEALYRMWSNGISLVTWSQLRDDPFPQSFLQCGLYFRGSTPAQDRAKPALRAFRFPFVALPAPGGATVWGRTPTARPGRVLVEMRAGHRWLPLAVLRANRYGIFHRRVTVRRGAALRARFGNGEYALPFRVVKTKDRPGFAFGTIPP